MDSVDKSAPDDLRKVPPRIRGDRVRAFITQHVTENPAAIAALTARTFGISRQAVNRHLDRLVTHGVLDVAGTTKGRKYSLRTTKFELDLAVSSKMHEDEIWTEHFAGHIADVPENVRRICYYGFTEMLNNVLDHSESPDVHLLLERSAMKIEMDLYDHGVGIFSKIQRACHLDTPRIAVFELTKGKFTTDPERHTGEGIFFTSRMFDSFSILSDDLFLAHRRGQNDWLLESRRNRPTGTSVFLEISPNSKHTIEEVLAHYASEQGDYAFHRTAISIKLALAEGEQLISRSQAKRISARLDKFKEVVLDFEGIASIGPAFADELFRVFGTQNRHVVLIPINANEQVTKMIRRAIGGSSTEHVPADSDTETR